MQISDTPRSDAFDLPLESLPLPLDLTSEIVKQDIALEIGRVEKVYRGVWTTKGIPVAIKYVEAVKRKVDDEREHEGSIREPVSRDRGRPIFSLRRLWGRRRSESSHRQSLGSAEPPSHPRLLRTVSRWISLDHPNILPMYGVTYDPEGTGFSLVTPYVPEGSLREWYSAEARRPRHDRELRQRLMAEVACGLAHLHEKGIVHGDIRAGKVLVTHCRDESLGTYKLRALICDSGFGDSGALRWRAWEREAPEQFTREFRDVKKEDLEGSLADKRCDVWSWGMTVVELFSAEVPFASLNQEQVKKALLEDDLYDWWHMAARNALTLELQQILPFCFQRDPRKRPTMQDILGGLRYRQPRAARGPSTVPRSPSGDRTMNGTGSILFYATVGRTDSVLRHPLPSGARFLSIQEGDVILVPHQPQSTPWVFGRLVQRVGRPHPLLPGNFLKHPQTEYNDQRHKAQLPVVATSSVGYKNRYGDITLPDQPLLVTTWPNGDAKCTGYRLRFTKESGFFPADHTRLISGPPIYAEGGQRQYYLQVTRSFSGAIVTHNAVPPGHVVGVTKAPERGLWTWELERSRNRDGDEPIISSGATESVNLVTFAQA